MSLITPIPNGPFYSSPSYYVNSAQGFLVIGTGLAVAPDGTLLASSTAGGTVTQVTAGTGLSGGTITTTGTIGLLPATTTSLGGIKVGQYLTVAPDGTLDALPPGIGTISGVVAGSGLTGGGTLGTVTLNVAPASTSQFGAVVIGAGINVTGGLISVASATTAAVGGVRLATPTEVITGTDNAKAVTPLGLASKVASTTASGLVQLSDNANLTSSVLAATPTAVKTAYDAAVAAQATAFAALPKAGGTMSGVITFDPAQTFPGVAFPKATTLSLGVVQVGSGLSITSSGVLSTANVGTVTAVICGPGLGSPASGNTISTSGTIRLLPPTSDGLSLGGVKAGANINIAFDGTISVPGSNFIASNNQYAFNGYQWPIPLASPSLPFPGINGQVLTVLDNVAGTIGWTSTGTLQSVVAGTGITVTSTPTTATVSLTTVPSITPGNVGGTALIPTLAVNAYGQITSTGLANPFAPFETPTVTAPFILVMDFVGNSTNWAWTTNGNTTIQNPLNAVSGQTGSLLITQDPLSTYSITWGNSWKFPNFTPFTGAGLAEVTMLKFTVVASNNIVIDSIVTNIG
jgi:hypothetical protein